MLTNTRVCRDCRQEFKIRGGRGRPPVRCKSCREEYKPTKLSSTPPVIEEVEEALDKQALSILKVDRLEEMLKSRGLHISQHRKDW